MSQQSVFNIALALALAVPGSAFAQSHGPDQRNNNDCPNGRCDGPQSQQRPGQNVRRPAPPPPQARNDWQNQYHRAAQGERGAGSNQSFHPGGCLPAE